jgi:amidase
MDLTFLFATALSDLVRTGKLGALEVLDHFIARTERLDGRINAVVVRDFDRARVRARDLDSQADKSAPLFGVPTTVKESFDVAGLPTTRGHEALKSRPIGISTIAVRRLEAAGAVVFGKTNVPVWPIGKATIRSMGRHRTHGTSSTRRAVPPAGPPLPSPPA